jgi:hypothetical protein
MKMLKRLFLSLLALALSTTAVTAGAASTQSASARKHALLIAIEKYNHGRSYFDGRQSDPVDLHTIPDVLAIKSVLVSKYQFKPEDITVLDKPEETTHAGIVKAFQDLIADTHPGDIVYFHYSGHGSRVPEHGPPSTWNEVDGWNEAMVPSDYKVEDEKHDLNFVIDDEIGSLIDQLMKKEPKLVTMSFDCCHSGSITRPFVTLRGRGFNYPYPDPHPGMRKQTTRGTDMSEVKAFFDKKDSNLVVLSAAQSNEVAHEANIGNTSMGLFTWALVKALQEATPKTTYGELYGQIKQAMIEKNGGEVQNPQLEGQADYAVLTGTAVAKPPAIKVVQKDGGFELQAGSMQQMTQGSKFAIYPLGANAFNEKNKIADAEILEVHLTTSDLDVSSKGAKVDLSTLQLASAQETDHAADNTKLLVSLDPSLSKETREAIREQLSENKAIVIRDAVDAGGKTNPYDVKLAPDANHAGGLLMEGPDGRTLKTVKSTSAPTPTRGSEEDGQPAPAGIAAGGAATFDANDLVGKLKSDLVCRFLSTLDKTPDNDSMAVQLRVVPVEVEKVENPGKPNHPHYKYVKDKTVPGEAVKSVRLSENEWYRLEVRNTGPVEAYITILDLMPDGTVQALFPYSKNQLVNENRIPPDGQWTRLPTPPYLFRVTAPFGSEKLKLIALSTPTSLAPLFTAGVSRDVVKKDPNPISQLLVSVSDTTRSMREDTPQDVAWSTDVFELQTVPAQQASVPTPPAK